MLGYARNYYSILNQILNIFPKQNNFGSRRNFSKSQKDFLHKLNTKNKGEQFLLLKNISRFSRNRKEKSLILKEIQKRGYFLDSGVNFDTANYALCTEFLNDVENKKKNALLRSDLQQYLLRNSICYRIYFTKVSTFRLGFIELFLLN